ncbi:glycosyl hydrolases family 2, TIM barrel domain [Kordia sp. SMS9]|uniref:glycoside hydrolase family 2 TIM barrel-domain containing protein n=1 Tax=Kordia sp. SMS9 TaxID=2282170 RepID=UPI000E0E07CB|nr:glycoside hydrolase family 2 TIM barrel-domain containing protein [Kordia sp. SMS9]AXG67921.1 glycosyl hydrolases family 2, TIM barrel domain [Kordia sp. SMS9]
MKTFVSTLLLCCVAFCNAQVTLGKKDTSWNILVDGKPFPVKGATFGHENDVANYDKYFKDLQELGVNTLRTWATGENTKAFLDAAAKYDIKVMVGIWMRHGRPGMEDDDSFDYLRDKDGMEAMYDFSINVVKMYKDHPAVLTWGVGNEVYLNMATDEEKEAYSKFLERVCSNIKKLDPNHPISSTEAWTFGLKWWQQYVPSIDIYGLNCYGAGANFLQEELEKRNIDKPYIITEFNVQGEWDIKNEVNGVKVEPSDEEKYTAIADGYKNWIVTKPNCLGVYVFHYADGNDYGSPWLFTHHRGLYRPTYWAIRKAFTGKKPTNAIPKIETFQLSNETINSNTWIPITLEVSDAENEALNISFYYNQHTGSRKRRSQIHKVNHRGSLKDGFEIQVPKEHGAVKVYVNVQDTFNNVGIASTGIQVNDAESKNRKYLVPKVHAPFYVYKDGDELPYIPTGYMGNYQAMKVDMQHTTEVYSGTSAIKIEYTERSGWYGLAFVDPKNDWGTTLGGYTIEGATKFSFWAKADRDGVTAKIGFGLIEKDKPFPDTTIQSEKITLSSKWKKYTLKIKRADLSCIRSGLVLFSNSYGHPQSIYLDEVVFE